MLFWQLELYPGWYNIGYWIWLKQATRTAALPFFGSFFHFQCSYSEYLCLPTATFQVRLWTSPARRPCLHNHVLTASPILFDTDWRSTLVRVSPLWAYALVRWQFGHEIAKEQKFNRLWTSLKKTLWFITTGARRTVLADRTKKSFFLFCGRY